MSPIVGRDISFMGMQCILYVVFKREIMKTTSIVKLMEFQPHFLATVFYVQHVSYSDHLFQD